MTMAPDVGTYTSLIQSVGEVLKAENDNEAQWFALPVGLVEPAHPHAKHAMAALPRPIYRLEQRYPGRVVPSQAKR